MHGSVVGACGAFVYVARHWSQMSYFGDGVVKKKGIATFMDFNTKRLSGERKKTEALLPVPWVCTCMCMYARGQTRTLQ